MNTADTTENTEKKTSALPAKKVSDSETHQLHVVIHPDINGFGRLFGGRLLEWIDEVAGATARRHCGRDATTVAIDNLYFKSGAYLNDIIVLIGKVTHVGHTSMEVRVDTYREEQDGTRHPINRAYFVMVAMGDNGKPTPVPGLILENDGERMEWDHIMVIFPIQVISDPEDFSVILVYLKRDKLFHDSSFSFSESTITNRFGGNVSASGLSSIPIPYTGLSSYFSGMSSLYLYISPDQLSLSTTEKYPNICK